MDNLAEGFARRDTRSLARALTLAETEPEAGWRLAGLLPAAPVAALRIGITGPPGAGKSCLVAALLRQAASEQKRVAVLAIDPSSPLSGGAFLADRLRMGWLNRAPETVFIRSVSTRGRLGGISSGTGAALELLTAFGFDLILVETVGVGQTEVDIRHWVDRVLLLLVGGLGDHIQLAKSGVIEAVHALVISKCAQPGSDVLESQLKDFLRGSPRFADPCCIRPELFRTDALTGEGIPQLWAWFAGLSATAQVRNRNPGAHDDGRERLIARMNDLFVREALKAISQVPAPVAPTGEMLQQVLLSMLKNLGAAGPQQGQTPQEPGLQSGI